LNPSINVTPFDLDDEQTLAENTFHCVCDREYVGRYWRVLAQVDQIMEAFAGRYRETRSTSPCEPPCRRTSLMSETRLAEECG
jgi:hypothetical protein